MWGFTVLYLPFWLIISFLQESTKRDSTFAQIHVRMAYLSFQIAQEPNYYLLIIYLKKLCIHVRKSHLEIKKVICNNIFLFCGEF